MTSALPVPRSGWPTLLLLLSGTFMVVLDFFIVNVALPSIQHDLKASDSAVQLVVAGYGLANAAGLITGGRLGDLFGRRRMFMLGLLLFTLASAACGLAQGTTTLIAARIVQGLAGALLQPQVLAMLGLVFTGEARAKAFGAYGVALGLAAALGQLVGGLLIHADFAQLGWRMCFLINLPIGLAGLLFGLRFIPPFAPEARSRLDVPGALWVALALAAVLWPLVEGRQQGWPLWSVLTLIVALPLIAGLALHQRRLEQRGGNPLIAPALFRLPAFVIGLGVTLAFFAGNASFYFVLALYLQQILGLEALASGLVFTVLAVGFFATSMTAKKLAARLGPQTIAIGALLLAAGHGLMIAVVLTHPGSGAVAWLLPVLCLQGAGLGMIIAPLMSAVLASVPAAHAGVAAGVASTVQQVGNSLGVALIGILFYAGWTEPRLAFVASTVYLLLLALAVAALFQRLQCAPQPAEASCAA
ncbi:MFS transporter [Variovorax sp. LjRoot175]|uniref:MFS transporter n=1 Tax=Variovorax sp. LjRoot175 TaxID=3342276 RepID=UPI003ED0224A